ncbi:MAG: hypothetical protein DRH57_03980 [Candidatus Cloacimonadota bacterium]|nr:MAG: hypothetical protein DRH57_03980 [Candidatus Cloacimonadota bacterium]
MLYVSKDEKGKKIKKLEMFPLRQNMNKTISSIRWTLSTSIIRRVITILLYIVIARSISKSDLGAFREFSIILGIFILFLPLGLDYFFIVSQKNNHQNYLNFSIITLLLGIISAIVLYFIAPILGNYYHSQLLKKFLFYGFLILIIHSFRLIFKKYFIKNIDFKTVSIAETINVLLYSVLVIIVLIFYKSVWVLFWGFYIGDTVETFYLFLKDREYFLTNLKNFISWKAVKQSYASIKENFSFCFNTSAIHIVNYLSNNAPIFLLGIYLSSAEVGIYYIANQMIALPVSLLTESLSRVFLPCLSRLQISQMRERINEFTKMATILIWPLFISFAFILDKLIILLLTEKWICAIPIARIILIYTGFNILVNPISSVPIIMRRPDLELKWNILATILKGTALIIGAKYGLATAILLFSFANVLLYLLFQYLIAYLLKMNFWKFISNYLFYLVYFIPYAIVLFLLKMLGMSAIMYVSFVLILNITIYFVLNYTLKGQLLNTVRQFTRLK